MGLSLLEQETIVTWNRAEDEMTVYTANPSVMRRLDGLEAYTKTGESTQDGEVVSMTFKADKALFQLKGRKRMVSDKQREAARRNLAKIRSEGK